MRPDRLRATAALTCLALAASLLPAWAQTSTAVAESPQSIQDSTSVAASPGVAAASGIQSPLGYADDRVVVVCGRDAASLEALYRAADRLGAEIRPIAESERLIAAVDLPAGLSVSEALADLSAVSGVLSVEPDYRYAVSGPPSDPRFPEQWGLHNGGETAGGVGKADADIDAPEAWDKETGSSDVIVAVIDTGVDYRHPDLKGNMWINPQEKAGNKFDDDGNGYVDDVHGIDALERSGDPLDKDGHGTHVAGVIGAVGDNGTGTSGVSWNVSIMALKVADKDGNARITAVIEAIDYAAAHGVKIVNCSFGGPYYSQALYEQMRSTPGCLYICAAGNNGFDADRGSEVYPASFALDNVLSVGASDEWDTRAAFSSYGARSVDVFAPGVGILSTCLPAATGSGSYASAYAVGYGTSMAAPFATGAAALALAHQPEISGKGLKRAIMRGADRVSALLGMCVTDGRVNAHSSLMSAERIVQNPVTFSNVAGRDRIATTLNASRTAFPERVRSVVVTTAMNWPDALGGAALAGAVEGPILLTPADKVPQEVLAEIGRLGATKAYILGGTSAVSSAAQKQIDSLPGVSVERIAGADRYETANKVAAKTIALLGDEYQGKAFMATGENFPDALASSSIMYAKGMPLVLVDKAGRYSLPAGVTKVDILGGTKSVPSTVEKSLGGKFGQRLSGADRYDTAAAVARYGVSLGLGWDKLAIASGEKFPDALAVGPMQGKGRSVVLLTAASTLPSVVRARLTDSADAFDVFEVRFIGGDNTLRPSVRGAVAGIVR